MIVLVLDDWMNGGHIVDDTMYHYQSIHIFTSDIGHPATAHLVPGREGECTVYLRLAS